MAHYAKHYDFKSTLAHYAKETRTNYTYLELGRLERRLLQGTGDGRILPAPDGLDVGLGLTVDSVGLTATGTLDGGA